MRTQVDVIELQKQYVELQEAHYQQVRWGDICTYTACTAGWRGQWGGAGLVC